MKNSVDQIREILVKLVLEGGERIERAVADGPRATLGAVDDLIATLDAAAITIAASLVLGGCGNPDCPNCGQAARDSAAAPTSTSFN